MKRLKGCRISVAGLPLLIAAAVLVLQVETAWPGTPGMCKEPCNQKSGAAKLPVQARGVEPGARASADTKVEPAGAPGHRAPLVVRQRVPARIHGGVYMPAHETYVVLRPGRRQPEDVKEETAMVRAMAKTPPAPKCYWLRLLFRRLGRCDGGP